MTTNMTENVSLSAKKNRNWKIRSIAALSIILFFILFILLLVYSNIGLKLTVFTLNKILPELKIERTEGSLSDLHLTQFLLQLDGVTVQINDASLSISGTCLLQGRICIKNFNAHNVLVRVNTEAFPHNDNHPNTNIDSVISDSHERWLLKMPLPIELNSTHLTGVNVHVDDMQFSMADFKGKAIWVNEKLYVYPSVAEKLTAKFPDEPNTQHQASNPAAIHEILNNLFNQPLIDSLPHVNIPLDINVASLTGNDWLLRIGGEDYQFKKNTIQTDMINNHIKLISLVTYAQSPYASGQVKASGEIILGDDWPIKTDITVKTANDTIESQVSGSLLGTFSAKAKITGLNQLNFNGQIDFAKKYAPIRLDLSGKQFRWPLTDNAKYHITHFSVSLSGTTNKYALSAKSTISGDDLPQTQFELLSDGTNQAIAFSKLNLAFKQGDFSAKGKMSWDKVFKWDVSTNLNCVDLSEELPNYPIQIQGKVDTTGELSPDKWLINLKKIQLDGNINSKKLFTTGAISIDSQHSIEANNFTVLLGKNQITANGSTLKNGIASQINISSLSSLSDDYSGSINGNINIAGSILKPTIAANLDIANVNWLTTSIKQASIIADITYHDQVSGALSITAKGLEYDHFNFDDVVFQLLGNEKNHTLDVKINGQPESLITHFKGSLDQNHTLWQVESSHVRLQLDNNNTWILDTPLILSYNLTKNIPSINAHCWKNGASHICVDETFSYAPKNETTITLTDIDLAKLPIPNNSDTKVAGNFDGKAYISLSKDATPNIKVAINSQAVFIEQHIVSQKLTIPFNLFAINANITPTQADLDWQFSLNEFGNMTGNIQISEPNSKKQLNGHIVIDNLSLSILNPLLQNNEHAKGAINGDLTLSGTLIDPLVTGKIGIESSDIKSNQLPVDIQSGILDINFYGRSSSLKGIINTKAGSIDIGGKANWNTIDKWQSSLSVKGSSLELSVPPMLNVTLVPNIQFEANENTLTLSGSVNIPKGSIVIESLPPSSIDVSNDEVLLDINNPSLGSASSMKIESKLDIIVGDKVSISAFGLNADLRGKLQLQQNNQGLGINGQIAINSGRFNAYGQDLIIRKGNIAFNGLIDRPTLNIEAIRNPEFIENNVTAGIRVNGTTDDAKVEVFADPAMSQQEAISYLLNGHGLDTSANSNDSMTGLLIGLGASQGGKYLGNVGDFFGIKNLSVDTKGSGDTSQVVVSGYLTSNLQLKYGVGLFDSLAQFTVRYRLIPKLYLEAITGTDQVINFLYQFEL